MEPQDSPDVNRRDFGKWTAAALGGLASGALIGCTPQQPAPAPGKTEEGKGAETAADENPLLSELHVCRGLNTCKGKGADGKNACAGQGTCATAEKHACQGQNACKGQGGCGEKPGQNACKGKGDCGVPLQHADAWKKAREAFEKAMKDKGKSVGPAPAEAKGSEESKKDA